LNGKNDEVMKMKKIFVIVAAIAMFLSIGFPKVSFAEELKTAECTMTITDQNDWFHKVQASGLCNGIIEGYYQADQDTFNIIGMITYPVEYNGQKFKMGIQEPGYLWANLTVYTKKTPKPAPKPEPTPTPKPKPTPAPAPAPKPVTKPNVSKSNQQAETKTSNKNVDTSTKGNEKATEAKEKHLVKNNKENTKAENGQDKAENAKNNQSVINKKQNSDDELKKQNKSIEKEVTKKDENKEEKKGFFSKVTKTISTIFKSIGSFFSNLF
jgi:hypothetical protein